MNTQRLLDLIKINEESEDFNLNQWFSKCGTYGCLVGNYVIKTHVFSPKRHLHILHFIPKHFDISTKQCKFLFDYKDSKKHHNVRKIFIFGIGPERTSFDKEAAINRVRKFVYYFLHKQEMIYDDRGCIKESARKAEGNHMVMEKVLTKIN